MTKYVVLSQLQVVVGSIVIPFCVAVRSLLVRLIESRYLLFFIIPARLIFSNL